MGYVYMGYVYIAGPYRARDMAHDYSAWCEINDNITEARRWAIRLAEYEIPYFCPHLNSEHMETLCPLAPPAYWYKTDLLLLEHAWAILLIPRWRESQGARAEKEFAMGRGIKVYTHNMFVMLLEDYRAVHTAE